MSQSYNPNLPATAQSPTLVPHFDQPTNKGLVTVLQSPLAVLADNPRVAATCDVTLSTNPTDADVLTLTLSNNVLPGGSLAVSVTASSDTTTTAAAKLAAALTANATAMRYEIYGTSLANVLTVHENGPVGNFCGVSFASTGSTTAAFSNQNADTVTVGGTVPADKWTATIGGTETDTDVVTLHFVAVGLPSGHKDVSVTASGAEAISAIATALRSAINADSDLIAANITCPSISTSTTLNISSAGPNYMTGLTYTQGGNTESFVITHVTRESIVLRFSNTNFSGGHEDVTHLVVNGDTVSTIAAALNTAINADATLQAGGVSSSVASAVLTINQVGPDFATLSNQTSGSPGETLTVVDPSGVLAGGSGPVIALGKVDSNQGATIINMLPGNPRVLDPNVLADLVSGGAQLK